MSSIQSASQSQNTSNTQNTNEAQKPDDSSVRDFNELLHAKKDNKGQNELFEKTEKMLAAKLQNESVSPNAESLYSSLFSQNLQTQSVKAEQAAQTQATNLSTDKVQELADRILVATNKDGSSEVRISLSDKALAGTDVNINRALDGQLTVRFDTTNANSFQTLVQSQDALKSALESQNSSVRVDISNGQDNPQGQSKGRMDYMQDEDEQ